MGSGYHFSLTKNCCFGCTSQELELYEVAQHINILKSPCDDDKLLVSVHAKAASCEVIMNDAKFHF